MRLPIRAFWAILLTSITTAGSLLIVQAPTSAAPTVKDQCIVDVVGKQADGTFILGATRCYATYADVLRSQGVMSASSTVSPATVTKSQLQASSILGTHYDGAGFSGASFSVTGTTCGGGGLNVPLSWNDRISSTANGCYQIVHYENTNYGGATESSFDIGGTLGALNNRTSSIKYFA